MLLRTHGLVGSGGLESCSSRRPAIKQQSMHKQGCQKPEVGLAHKQHVCNNVHQGLTEDTVLHNQWHQLQVLHAGLHRPCIFVKHIQSRHAELAYRNLHASDNLAAVQHAEQEVTSFLQVPSMGRYHPAWYNEHLPQQIHIPGTRAWLGRRAIASISRTTGRVLHISLEPNMLSIYSLFQPEKSRYCSRDFDPCVFSLVESLLKPFGAARS